MNLTEQQLTELLETAADPSLIASAKEANLLLADLNSIVADLRGNVRDLELEADLHHNHLLQQEGKPVALKESEYKISTPYTDFKKKAGQLSDIRSIRKALQRHADLLFEQEKFAPRDYGRAIP